MFGKIPKLPITSVIKRRVEKIFLRYFFIMRDKNLRYFIGLILAAHFASARWSSGFCGLVPPIFLYRRRRKSTSCPKYWLRNKQSRSLLDPRRLYQSEWFGLRYWLSKCGYWRRWMRQ